MSNSHRHHRQFNPIEFNTMQPIDSMHSLGAAIVDLAVNKIVTYEEFFRGVALQLIHTRK